MLVPASTSLPMHRYASQHQTTTNIHPNNRAAESDCLWQSCTAHKRCHISPAVSHQRREHSRLPQHCLRLTQYRRQPPRLSPHVPLLIQLQHLPAHRVRYQRQRYQLQRHSPPGRGIGTRLLSGSLAVLIVTLESLIKTCAGRALPRTMEPPGRYRRIPHT